MSEFEDKLQSILGDPQAMGQIMSLAQSLGGTGPTPTEQDTVLPSEQDNAAPVEETTSPFSMLHDLDPRLLQMGMRLLSEYNRTDDRKTALLNALRPFLREIRYAKVDQAVQIARLSRVIRVALDVFRREDTKHV